MVIEEEGEGEGEGGEEEWGIERKERKGCLLLGR